MDLAFQDRLEVSLHLATGNFHPNTKRQQATSVYIRSDNIDLAVAYAVIVNTGYILEGKGLVTAHFDIGIFLADSLTFEGRAVRYGNRYMGNLDFATTYFKGFFHHFFVGNIGHYVLVSTNTGG